MTLRTAPPDTLFWYVTFRVFATVVLIVTIVPAVGEFAKLLLVIDPIEIVPEVPDVWHTNNKPGAPSTMLVNDAPNVPVIVPNVVPPSMNAYVDVPGVAVVVIVASVVSCITFPGTKKFAGIVSVPMADGLNRFCVAVPLVVTVALAE